MSGVYYLIDHLCMLLRQYGMPLIYILDYYLLMISKKRQDTSPSEVLCKPILIIFRFIVSHEENLF